MQKMLSLKLIKQIELKKGDPEPPKKKDPFAKKSLMENYIETG